MAPDTVAHWLKALPPGACVLDPMCGSGVVVRQSALLGHRAKGFDIDPLAVLMSKVWTRTGTHEALSDIASALIDKAKRRTGFSHLDLPWVAGCPETRTFIEYWFAQPQRSDLARLAWEIERLRRREDAWLCDALQLAMSRIIVTKHAGASLAWDVPHSRPHRKRDENDFEVYEGFRKAVARLAELLDDEALPRSGTVKRGDCRKLSTVKSGSVDAVVTSPPYLNAIDYLRGHKLSLVWMGHGIPALRDVRAGAVGTERAGARIESDESAALEKAVCSIRKLPQRQRAIVHKYAQDAALIVKEMKRVLKPDGLMVLVLGDSNLRGVPVYNSKIFKHIAAGNGFVLDEEEKRPLQSDRRYLPITGSSAALAKRMKTEVLQAYRRASSA
jgi:SAM-dependent methyltransferase